MRNTNEPLTPEQITEFKTSLDEIQCYYTDSIKVLIKEDFQPNYESYLIALNKEINEEVPLYEVVHALANKFQYAIRQLALVNATVEATFLPKVNKLVTTLN